MCDIVSVQSMTYANNWVCYGLNFVLVCFHITFSIVVIKQIPESTELLECLSGIVCQMCATFCPFPQLPFMQYMGISGLSLPKSVLMIFFNLLAFIIKSYMKSLTNFSVSKSNKTMRCMFCYALIIIGGDFYLQFEKLLMVLHSQCWWPAVRCLYTKVCVK